MAKAFSELSEREILALAISLEEDDARIYGDYADRLKADYPDTAKMLKIMQDEELVHAQRLMDTSHAQFGEHIPFIQRQDVKGFLRRKPLWLAKVLFALEESLVYMLNSISSNGSLLERMKSMAGKLGFDSDQAGILEDLIIENQQCYRRAEIQ